MNGLHLSAEFHDCCCAASLLSDEAALREGATRAVRAARLNAVGQVFHRFGDTDGHAGGVTGVVLLAESHLALHTWPELGTVTLDVYVCNRSGDHSDRARQVMAVMQALFQPGRTEQREVIRGAVVPGPAPR